MKSLALAFAFLLGSFSFAQTSEGTLDFVVLEAQFAENHVPRPGAARIHVNLAEAKAKLTVEQRYYCPPQMICAAVMPLPFVVELPITEIKDAGCGIRMITAQVDNRPADGHLQVLTIEDATQMTCPTFAPYKAKASYTTKAYDRMNGMEIQSDSTMVIEAAPEKIRDLSKLTMSEGSFFTGFSMFEKPFSGTLEIGETEVKMEIQVRLNCGKGKACPRYMPRPMFVTLPITNVERTEHGTRIIAQMEDFSANGIRESLEILDLRDCRVCVQDQFKSLKVDYRGQAQTADGVATRRATFYFY